MGWDEECLRRLLHADHHPILLRVGEDVWVEHSSATQPDNGLHVGIPDTHLRVAWRENQPQLAPGDHRVERLVEWYRCWDGMVWREGKREGGEEVVDVGVSGVGYWCWDWDRVEYWYWFWCWRGLVLEGICAFGAFVHLE